MSPATTQEWQHDSTTSERELLREVALALRGPSLWLGGPHGP
jgi:hypothetical protein